MKLSTLKKQAQASTTFRGHSMRWHQAGPHVLIGNCARCDCSVAVDSQPPPNGIEIGGDAVAITCDPKQNPQYLLIEFVRYIAVQREPEFRQVSLDAQALLTKIGE